jgi:hypothetical protein
VTWVEVNALCWLARMISDHITIRNVRQDPAHWQYYENCKIADNMAKGEEEGKQIVTHD